MLEYFDGFFEYLVFFDELKFEELFLKIKIFNPIFIKRITLQNCKSSKKTN